MFYCVCVVDVILFAEGIEELICTAWQFQKPWTDCLHDLSGSKLTWTIPVELSGVITTMRKKEINVLTAEALGRATCTPCQPKKEVSMFVWRD